MSRKLNDLSRAVSHALRHEPWLYELELDEEGWTGVDALIAALQLDSEWRSVTRDDIAEMMRTSSRQRHEMANGRIRALYGHSVTGKLRKMPSAPPDVLFHGTGPATVSAIRQQGLLAMTRQYVHLSVDREMAQAVGQRKGPAPVILTVNARQAAMGGVTFYIGNDKVWLADQVPPRYIVFNVG
jgi:putative RNA 2'-phosphotransferase